MAVWESKLFTDETSNAVSYEKYSTKESGSIDGGISKKYDCENTKKEYSFEKYCEEGAWEVHRSMYLHSKRTCVWCIAGKFLIDPIPESSESKSYRNNDSKMIDEIPKIISILARKKDECCTNPEKPSMKAHASFPNFEDFKGV